MRSKRKPSHKQQAKDSILLCEIEAIKAEHPFWGYRRVWAWLKYVNGYKINPKRVERLMKLYKLCVDRKKLKANRTSHKQKPRPCAPNEWWGIDMTKALTDEGWAYIVLVVDWFSKKIVGFEIDSQSRTKQWLKALDMGLNSSLFKETRVSALRLLTNPRFFQRGFVFLCGT